MEKSESFLTAIKDHENIIYKIASLYTNNIHDRNDLVQEIMYQLWKSFDSFAQKSSLSTWMYRVAMNVAIYQLKTTKRKVVTVPLDEEHLNIRQAAYSDLEEKLLLFRQQLSSLNLLDKGIVVLI